MGSEFDLIDRLFGASRCAPPGGWPPGSLPGGDDAALISAPAPGFQLVWALDTMVEHRHFWSEANPRAVGEKLLAVNLSDLAAMGARPLGCLLSLAVPDWSEATSMAWLDSFAEGLRRATVQHACPLYGGDTVRLPAGSPRVLSITVLGECPAGQALRRDGAHPGDEVWVSGSLGDAAWAVARGEPHERLDRPQPRLALGQALRAEGLAHAAIDLSDGLAGDLAHILRASAAVRGPMVAELSVPALWQAAGESLRESLRESLPASIRGQPTAEALRLLASGGDDYELCFTAAADAHPRLLALAERLALPLTCVGHLRTAAPGEPPIVWRLADGQTMPEHEQPQGGFDHG